MTDSAQTRTEGNTTAVTVADVRTMMDAAYPPALAESWGKAGLICGDPQDKVRRITLALDCTDEIVDHAIASGAQMLVVHHPLLLRGVNSVAADTPKGRIIHKLVRVGVALFTACTNADSVRPSVSDQLATALGIEPGTPLAPQSAPGLNTWTVKIPTDYVNKVAQATFEAGVDTIGEYDSCVFRINGRSQFHPLSGANPFIGAKGQAEYVEEARLGMVAPRVVHAAIVKALVTVHPYEEPAFDIVDNQATGLDPQQAVGIGRVGTLDTPMPFKDFVTRVAECLPATVWGVCGAGDPERMIRTIAVAPGSGDSFLGTVAKMGVDAFVTSDLRHYPVDGTLRTADFCVVDTTHQISEFPWCYQTADMLVERPGAATEVLGVRTDPWIVAKSSTQARK